MSNPWAFKIDYDKSIAEDERVIDAYGSVAAAAASMSLTQDELIWLDESGAYDAVGFLFAYEDTFAARLTMLGVTEAEAFDLATFREVEDIPWVFVWLGDYMTPGCYLRGKAIDKRLELIPVVPEARRLDILKRARAALSRHRRNKARG